MGEKFWDYDILNYINVIIPNSVVLNLRYLIILNVL